MLLAIWYGDCAEPPTGVIPFGSTNGDPSDTNWCSDPSFSLIDIEYLSVGHHRRVKAASKLFFCVSFLVPDGSRPLMTSAPVAPCINKTLPEEAFGIIFEEHAKLEWRAPIIDGQVCHQWRRIILRSPRAWAHLEINQNFKSAPSKLRQWLNRSRSAPLHVQVLNLNRDVREALGQRCERIESMALRVPHRYLLNNRSFPILQSLTITDRSKNHPVLSWSTCCVMPELRSLRASDISVDTLPSNIFPVLRVLALSSVKNCDSIIRNTSHSLTSLMMAHISFKHTSESLDFPSLRFLTLFEVKNIKHRMNVPALTAYHESDGAEAESFSTPLLSLIEYGLYHILHDPPLDITKLHQCYPNITRLSVRAHPSDLKLFLHSLSHLPTTLPMLRILAVESVFYLVQCSGEDKARMMKDAAVRNMASSVKMELCFDGMVRVPLYFAFVTQRLEVTIPGWNMWGKFTLHPGTKEG